MSRLEKRKRGLVLCWRNVVVSAQSLNSDTDDLPQAILCRLWEMGAYEPMGYYAR